MLLTSTLSSSLLGGLDFVVDLERLVFDFWPVLSVVVELFEGSDIVAGVVPLDLLRRRRGDCGGGGVGEAACL